MTLIAWTRLTENYSALISDALITGESQEGSDRQTKLPSDSMRRVGHKSADLGYILPELIPKTHVVHPTIAISLAGSLFIAKSLLKRISLECSEKSKVSNEYISNLVDEMRKMNNLSFILIHISDRNDIKIYYDNLCETSQGWFDQLVISSGSGAKSFINLQNEKRTSEHFSKNKISELGLAYRRAISMVYSEYSAEFVSPENLYNSFGGVLECLYFDHLKGEFFSFSNIWATFSFVYPVERNLRNFHPSGLFINKLYDFESKSLILDRYFRFKKTSRGFNCKKKRFIANRIIKDFRNILKFDSEIWNTTYFIIDPDGDWDFTVHEIDQKDSNKHWIKVKKNKNGTEFQVKGFRFEENIPNNLYFDDEFDRLLKALSGNHEKYYRKPYGGKVFPRPKSNRIKNIMYRI